MKDKIGEKKKAQKSPRRKEENTVVSFSLLSELGGVDVLFSLVSHYAVSVRWGGVLHKEKAKKIKFLPNSNTHVITCYSKIQFRNFVCFSILFERLSHQSRHFLSSCIPMSYNYKIKLYLNNFAFRYAFLEKDFFCMLTLFVCILIYSIFALLFCPFINITDYDHISLKLKVKKAL